MGGRFRNAFAGWGISAIIALGAASLLVEASLARNLILTALTLTTTAIGALMPVLRDSEHDHAV
jgi:hypothetical protein